MTILNVDTGGYADWMALSRNGEDGSTGELGEILGRAHGEKLVRIERGVARRAPGPPGWRAGAPPRSRCSGPAPLRQASRSAVDGEHDVEAGRGGYHLLVRALHALFLHVHHPVALAVLAPQDVVVLLLDAGFPQRRSRRVALVVEDLQLLAVDVPDVADDVRQGAGFNVAADGLVVPSHAREVLRVLGNGGDCLGRRPPSPRWAGKR